MSLISKKLSTPFSVRVVKGRFAGAVGTAVAMFSDGVYVIHTQKHYQHLTIGPNNAFAIESEIERLDK